MTLANAGTNTERLRKGDLADLAIVLPQQWETLRQEGKIDPAVRAVIGKVGLGAFVKKGAALPDIRARSHKLGLTSASPQKRQQLCGDAI
jgi:hypothetical protein